MAKWKGSGDLTQSELLTTHATGGRAASGQAISQSEMAVVSSGFHCFTFSASILIFGDKSCAMGGSIVGVVNYKWCWFVGEAVGSNRVSK